MNNELNRARHPRFATALRGRFDDARDQLRAIYAQTLNGACKQASQQ
jgi:hypothetical protein